MLLTCGVIEYVSQRTLPCLVVSENTDEVSEATLRYEIALGEGSVAVYFQTIITLHKDHVVITQTDV